MIIILFCILYVGEKFTNKNLKIHQLYLTRMIHFVVNSFRKVVEKKKSNLYEQQCIFNSEMMSIGREIA